MIDLLKISLQFSGKYLFSDVNLKINSGDRFALVGSNGSGKSSLLKMISGSLEPESGKIQRQKRISIGYLPQENVVHTGKSLINEASSALEDIQYLLSKQHEITENLSSKEITEEEQNDLVHQLADVHEKLDALETFSANSRVEKVLMGLGFEESDFERLTDEFSGGWQMRIALAKLLLAQNDILLFDEPTNHLDLDSMEWLIDFIKKYKGAFVIVSHDRHFINQTTERTIELFNGKLNIYNGKYEKFLGYKEERDSLLIHQQVQQQKKIKETEKFIERFRYKATKAKQVQSRIKQLDKIELIETPDDESKVSINFPEPPKSGILNIELNEVSKSYDSKLVLQSIDFRVNRGDKIAFVGPNGAGKTTLGKIIAGKLDFNSGERTTGHNTIISYYSQDVADGLDSSLNILESVEGISKEKTPAQLRSVLGSFLFSGDDVFKKVGVLSGGEKSRLALAKILLTKANFIILDEPTNHLDFASKKVLQSALVNFKGSLILVSHDIEFLKPIVNKVVDVRKGKIKIYEDGIEYYLYKRGLIEQTDLQKENSVIENNISKKDRKRVEAEQRNKKYALTKDLKKQISVLEKTIEKLELRSSELERLLAEPDTYNNPQKIKYANAEFLNIKDELNRNQKKWEQFAAEIERIENQFS